MSETADSTGDGFRVVGIDVGGTFTDVAALDPASGDLLMAKVPTTPQTPEEGLGAGLRRARDALGAPAGEVRHGTTIVVNALLEGRLASAALLCTRGFRDVLELRRLWREHLFGYEWERPETLIPRALRLEVDERIGPDGEVLRPLDEEEVRRHARWLRQAGVQAVAVAYLFSFRNPAHERRTAAILGAELPGVAVSISSEILPEVHEYERTSTTVLNVLVRPIMERYLATVEGTLAANGARGPLRMVRSDGTLMSPSVAAREPVRLVHSGPAAGVTGAARLGRAHGWPNLLTLDMGGTSTDVALVWDGRPQRTFESDVRWNIPIRTAQIDIRSIGAGGGSIVGLDAGGGLFVGPESAGAHPGPACYGRGGARATVTDALLCLGVLPAELLGGALPLQRAPAEAALRAALPGFPDAATAAEAAYAVTLHKMAVLAREVTVNQGYDPRDCVLVCFGGAGGSFALDLAREMEIATVYVPPAASVFSALGAALARVSYEASVGLYRRVDGIGRAELDRAMAEVEMRATEALAADGLALDRLTVEVDLRYRAQPTSLAVPLRTRDPLSPPGADDEPPDRLLAGAVRRFHAEHARLYHLQRDGEAVDLVALRAVAHGPDLPDWPLRESRSADPPVSPARHRRDWRRGGAVLAGVPVLALPDVPAEPVGGPLFLEDAYTTVAVPPDASARRDAQGGVLLEWDR